MFKKILIILIIFALVLSGCAPFSNNEPYAWREKIAGDGERGHFSFPNVLTKLYPETVSIVTGYVEETMPNNYSVQVTEILDGSVPNETISVYNSSGHPLEDRNQYLLFLTDPSVQENELIANFDLLSPDSGQILLSDKVLYPVPGVTLDLELAKAELVKLNQNVPSPSIFRYYQTLEGLVTSSDVVMYGEVVKIEKNVPINFYIREEGFEEISTEDTMRVTIKPNMMLKGNEQETYSVLLEPTMIQNTIRDSTLEHTTYTESDMPMIYEGVSHLFFLVNSPGSKNNTHCFFINPFQGYVPMVDSMLSPIPINEVFSMAEEVSLVTFDIQNIIAKYQG